jgi:hypothetical protein
MLAMISLAWTQEASAPSFLVEFKHTRVILPLGASSACMVVFSDGKFRLERSDLVHGSVQVFENSLSPGSVDTLSVILGADNLKRLAPQKGKPGVKISEGDIVWAIIPRADFTQKLVFSAVSGSKVQVLPDAIRPLTDWFQATLKSLEQQSIRAMTNTAPTNCGFGTRESQSARSH